MPNGFRVYLRDLAGKVVPGTLTQTQDRDEAAQAFAALVNDPTHDGQPLVAVLIYQHQHWASHRFDKKPGDEAYWRGRLEALTWPNRGGRPAELEEGDRYNVYLDGPSVKTARALGHGNVSAGVREALTRIRQQHEEENRS